MEVIQVLFEGIISVIRAGVQAIVGLVTAIGNAVISFFDAVSGLF